MYWYVCFERSGPRWASWKRSLLDFSSTSFNETHKFPKRVVVTSVGKDGNCWASEVFNWTGSLLMRKGRCVTPLLFDIICYSFQIENLDAFFKKPVFRFLTERYSNKRIHLTLCNVNKFPSVAAEQKWTAIRWQDNSCILGVWCFSPSPGGQICTAVCILRVFRRVTNYDGDLTPSTSEAVFPCMWFAVGRRLLLTCLLLRGIWLGMLGSRTC